MSDFRSGDRVRDVAGRTGTVVDLTTVEDEDGSDETRVAVLVRPDGSDEIVGYLERALTKLDAE